MTVSAISGVTIEGQPQELSSFLRAGVVYVLWHTPITSNIKRLSWKPHTGADFTEVIPQLGQSFHDVTALYDPVSDQVVVVWDDSQAVTAQGNGTLYCARFNVLSGSLVFGPVALFPGSNPSLSYAQRGAIEGAWTPGLNMLNARIAPALTALSNGDIVVTGGDDGVGPIYNTANVERINYAGTTTTPLADMNYRRSYHTCITLPDDSVFVIGGNQGGPTPFIHRGERFDPATGTWTLTPNVPTSTEEQLWGIACTVLNDGRVAVYGGDPNPLTGSLATKALHHIFNPATNTWKDMGTPAVTSASAVLVTLPDGRVLRVGGYTRAAPFAANVYTSTAEIWNPTTGVWSSITGTGLAAASQHSVLLRDGTFLVFGGYAGTPGTGPLNTYLYTPDSSNGSWKRVGDLPVPMEASQDGGTNDAAVLMEDGGVIAIGSNDPVRVPLTKTVAYYDTVLQQWAQWVNLPDFYGEACIARLSNNRVIHLGGDLNDTYVFSNTTRVVTGPRKRPMMLYYRTAKSGGVYGCSSFDGGLTWKSAYPLITGKVSNTAALDISAYSSSNASIAQLGAETRQLREISSLQRTRPLTSIVKHPTVAGQFFIGEPSKGPDNVSLSDNLRGALVLATDASGLYHLDGVQQGTSDAVGAVALLNVVGTTISVSSSAGPVLTPAGRNVVSYSLAPSLGSLSVVLPGSIEYAVGMDVSTAYAYVAQYADNQTTAGKFMVVDLTSGSTGTVLSGLNGVRGIAVANFLATPLIFVATTESGVEYLRIYQQNGLTPTLLMPTAIPKLTSRANFLSVTVDPSNPTGALIYASLVDRLNVYQYINATTPVQLKDSLTLPGGGSFFQSKVSSNGNVAVAAGNAGVLMLDPDGKILAQTPVSGESILEWRASTVYPLNALVRPRENHQFARSRYYFKATTGGTSGGAEPLWAATGTVLDNTAQWQAVGLVDGVAVGLELDEDNAHVLVAGSAGGNLGTDGRVWMVSAAGLIRNRGHVLDANTLALWRFDNLGGTVEPDISGNGYALTALHDSTSIAGNARYARHLTGNSGTGLWSAPAPTAITPLHGEYTVEMWIRTNALSNGVLLGFRVAGGISYPSQDPLLELGISGPGTFLYLTVYYGGGPLFNYAGANAVTNGVWTHVAGRKRLNGAGPNYDLHVFVNGVQVGQTLNVPGPAVGDGNDTNGAWAVGSTYPGTGPFALYTNVDVDDIRVSKVARTDAEILSSYTRGGI